MAETKRVHVNFAPEGAGLALAIADQLESADSADSADSTDGVLHISDACITLEIPTTDGRPSVLAWDPAEVSWDSLGLAASA